MGVQTSGLDQKLAKDVMLMQDKGSDCTVSVQVSRASQTLTSIAIAASTLCKWETFIHLFKHFVWVYRLLVWTKSLQKTLFEYRTNVQTVQ